MNSKIVNNIVVLGTGNMGPGISFLFASHDYNVTMWGPSDADIIDGSKNFMTIIKEMLSNGIINFNEHEIIKTKIKTTTNLKEATINADFIIEAIPEQLELKQEMFNKLEGLCSAETIFASNTSTLLPSDLSKRIKNKNRLLVAHFWNPAYLAPLVEICGSKFTSPEVINRTINILRSVGSDPVLIRKEILGFIGNRIMHAMNREALAMIGNGVCDPEDIDKVVLASFGPRFANLGPMEYLDFSGLDLIKNIQGYLYSDLDSTKGPLPIIEKLVLEGSLGIKTGRGLFEWNNKENRIRENRDKEFINRLIRNKN